MLVLSTFSFLLNHLVSVIWAVHFNPRPSTLDLTPIRRSLDSCLPVLKIWTDTAVRVSLLVSSFKNSDRFSRPWIPGCSVKIRIHSAVRGTLHLPLKIQTDSAVRGFLSPFKIRTGSVVRGQ